MRRFRFKPEDFDVYCTEIGDRDNSQCIEAANKANELLEAHEKTLPRVYGIPEPAEGWNGYNVCTDTHTALLYNVEQIGEEIK